ncbi:hypothetical protein [Streptomyces sp. NPDC005077]|uniref:hypothetical protein n=1 Tax=Streptomyces sp. NPDC005077 TaxID=3154292 RepID=UPI0033BAF460
MPAPRDGLRAQETTIDLSPISALIPLDPAPGLLARLAAKARDRGQDVRERVASKDL